MCLAFRNSCSQRAVFGGATNSKGIQSKKPANNRLIHILGHSCLAGTSVVRDLASCLAVSSGDFQAHGCYKCCNIRRKVETWFEKPEVIHPKLGRSHRVQARCFGITGMGHLFMFNFCSALAHIDDFLSLKPNNIACGKDQGVCKGGSWKPVQDQRPRFKKSIAEVVTFFEI